MLPLAAPMQTHELAPPPAPATRPASDTPLAWRMVRVGGLRVRARHAPGPGADGRTGAPPVVLVHGLGVSSAYHVRLARRLATRRAVWVPDLPGHGRSDRAPSPLDVPGLADALLDWMDAVGLTSPVLVGQSLGCQVVVELAARWPDRAAALVLVAPTPDPAVRSPGSVLWRLLADVPHERPSLIPIVVADYLRAGPRQIVAEYRAMLSHPMAAALWRVGAHGVPCTVVRGEHDPLVGAAWCAEVARLAGAPPPIHVAAGGHAVQHECPEAVAAVVEGVQTG